MGRDFVGEVGHSWLDSERVVFSWLGKALLYLIFFLFIFPAHANDLRLSGFLSSGGNSTGYTLRVRDCTSVTHVTSNNGDGTKYLLEDAVRVVGSATACEFPIDALDTLSPAFTIHRLSGSADAVVQESYDYETNRPSISFESVSIEQAVDGQYLVAVVNADDDVDIKYVSFDILGLRASELRRVGGIVNEASKTAFAKTERALKIYPDVEGQTQYTARVRLNTTLTADAVAQDGVVLLEAMVVDSSGNQNALSRLAFTGQGVSEKVLGMTVSPNRVVINNLLDSRIILPVVDYQFRGPTELPGQGTGVTYNSSRPDLVQVTAGGLIFPLAETTGDAVTITVSYPDLPDVMVPVEVDFNKELIDIAFEGLVNNQMVLPQLNDFIELPPLVGTFNDGSTVEFGTYIEKQFNVASAFAPVLSVDNELGIKSTAEITQSDAVSVQVTFPQFSGLQTELFVSAIDALPEISIDTGERVVVGSEIKINLLPTDDVGVERVLLKLNGVVINDLERPPWQISIPVDQSMVGQRFEFTAEVFDSKGQSNISPPTVVSVLAERVFSEPSYEWVAPKDFVRVVEDSPMLFSVEAVHESPITYVEFFFENDKVAESFYPILERRIDGTIEIWRATAIVPRVSTRETSLATHARIYSRDGGVFDTPSRLVRIIENSPPTAVFLSPQEGDSVTVGEEVFFRVQVADDTLQAGTEVELLLGDEVIGSRTLSGGLPEQAGALAYQTIDLNFRYQTLPEQVGQVLAFRVRTVDSHELLSETQPLYIPVNEDQLPTAAVANPVEGAHFVAGQNIELRANATDDVKVANVAFYVDDQLIGIDYEPPFALIWETQPGKQLERPFAVHVIAEDSAGQQAKSNTVHATLGQDETPPVVNLASPSIEENEGGEDIAKVIEDSTVVLKFVGYDNIGVTRAVLEGISHQPGLPAMLTGSSADVLTDENLPIQAVPGALSAYSIIKLITIPGFSNDEGSSFDRYPISMEVFDEVGNSSLLDVTIGVIRDEPPKVVDVITNKAIYNALSLVELDVAAEDDRGVARLDIKIFDGTNNEIAALALSAGEHFSQATQVTSKTTVDLAVLNVPNVTQNLRIEVIATDIKGLVSDPFEVTAEIQEDDQAPLGSVQSPIQSTELIAGQSQVFEWRVADRSGIQSAKLTYNGSIIDQLTDGVGDAEFQQITTPIVVPDNIDELLLVLEATDVFGQTSTSNWRYGVGNNSPPVITVRTPVSGSRFIEGESLTINASVTDDDQVENVLFFIEQGGSIVQTHIYEDAAEINAIQNDGRYLSAGFRMPTQILDSEGNNTTRVGITALDSYGASSTFYLQLETLDDLNPPTVTLLQPTSTTSIFPGNELEVRAIASDDKYVSSITFIVVDEDGQEIFLESEFSVAQSTVEQIKVPNPGTLGAVIVDERYLLDQEATLLFPEEMIFTHAGQTLQLFARASDNGVNTTDSEKVGVLIMEDKEPPTIDLKEPIDTLYDRQLAFIDLFVSDNVQLSTVRVLLDDEFSVDESTLLFEETDIENKYFNWYQQLDLSPYAPIPVDGKEISLIVEAEDYFGNAERYLRLITILPDQPPVLTLKSSVPEGDVLKGGLVHDVFMVEDDYYGKGDNSIPQSDRVRDTMLFYTSLSDMLLRSPIGGVVPGEVLGNSGLQSVIAQAAIAFPEAEGWEGELRANNEIAFSVTDDNLLINPGRGGTRFEVRVDGLPIPINYKITIHSASVCLAVPESIELNAVTELDLAEYYIPDDTTRIEVEVSYPEGIDGPQFLKGFSIEGLAEPRLGGINHVFDFSALTWKFLSYEGLDELGRQNKVQSFFKVSRRGFNFLDPTVSLVVPVLPDLTEYSAFGVPLDHHSVERGPFGLSPILTKIVQNDTNPPVVELSQLPNPVLRPLERVDLVIRGSDNSRGYEQLHLQQNFETIRAFGGQWSASGDSLHTLKSVPLIIPREFSAGELNLNVSSSDAMNNTDQSAITVPLAPNEPPKLSLDRFASYKSDRPGTPYEKVYTDPARLDFGEFWVRSGEAFLIGAQLNDDVGIASYQIYRTLADGTRISPVLFERSWAQSSCGPTRDTLQANVQAEILFDQSEPTLYELVLTDTYGHEVSRQFIVHPLNNVPPEIRITAPADQQSIVAGFLNVKLGIVATDDRRIPYDERDPNDRFDDRPYKIAVFANGVELDYDDIDGGIGGEIVVEQAWDSIYNYYQRYGPDIAEEYGHSDSVNAVDTGFLLPIPAGVYRDTTKLVITATVTDSEGAVGRDEIELDIDPDNILPELYVEPVSGFAPVENSDMTLTFAGYDNVKVEQLELYRSYSVRQPDESVDSTDWEFLETQNSIPPFDFEPVTTIDIDTPRYSRLVHVDSYRDIVERFNALTLTDESIVFVSYRLVARDAAGNSNERIVSYRVQVDQRPVVDIVEPLPGSRVVEGSKLYVNAHAFDDVAIDHVRLIITYEDGTPYYDLRLNAAPYNFVVQLPTLETAAENSTIMDVYFEATDTYGVIIGDLDKHRATESLKIELVEDAPPVVAIGTPVTGDTFIEGERMLVQVNAIDDIQVDSVVLQIDGLITGSSSQTDFSFPYDFFVDIPPGQANKPLSLTAHVREKDSLASHV